ncbi:heme o synthase [Streptomyces sp. NBC_00557]|uniref:heme o synthase n=1 Tax=Streptomyces sp. NBC_00557 TaxID=2975776 RepID=UPI002E8169CD|nr:heme o synthase [Streptomyces sp. NBC_00557]WUC40338.1 heme o synthase [Streptomyces sp. NBC_00557]
MSTLNSEKSMTVTDVNDISTSVPLAVPPNRPSVKDIAGAYLSLCKPRIVELLLVSALPTLFVASRGFPSFGDFLVVVVGGTCAAASAGAFNCFIDRDIDQLMERTRNRPLARHQVAPRAALIFGTCLGVVSVGLFLALSNLLAAVLTLCAIGYYALVYSLLLKRRTAQSTLWGGLCGSAPVLIAWATVTGSLSWTALCLFLVVFFWQPPHFWALAIKYRDDYARADIPVLPVVASTRRVLAESIVHSWLMVFSSVAVWPLAPTTPFYGVVSIGLGGAFLVKVHSIHQAVRRDRDPQTMGLFHGSIVYLTLLFASLAVDAVISSYGS